MYSFEGARRETFASPQDWRFDLAPVVFLAARQRAASAACYALLATLGLEPPLSRALGLDRSAVGRIRKESAALATAFRVWVYRTVGNAGLPALGIRLLRSYPNDPAQEDLLDGMNN